MYNVDKVWRDWKTVSLIGEGSFGKVYEIARDRYGVEERCALKVISLPSSTAEVNTLRNEGMDDESVTTYYKTLAEDFVHEIALMSKLKGETNIVSYEDYEVIKRDDIGWDILIRMELLKPLSQVMREKDISQQDIIDIGISMCSALSVCHSRNIIHRDIKIDNIFVSENGVYKLGDFGIARTLEKTSGELSKKGTYSYMAPEVYRGEAYNKTVDIYSLGMVMYRLLNFGREPFMPMPPRAITYSDRNNALVARMRGEVLPPPANADEKLSALILKACAFEAGKRFSTAQEMETMLRALSDAPQNESVVGGCGETTILNERVSLTDNNGMTDDGGTTVLSGEQMMPFADDTVLLSQPNDDTVLLSKSQDSTRNELPDSDLSGEASGDTVLLSQLEMPQDDVLQSEKAHDNTVDDTIVLSTSKVAEPELKSKEELKPKKPLAPPTPPVPQVSVKPPFAPPVKKADEPKATTPQKKKPIGVIIAVIAVVLVVGIACALIFSSVFSDPQDTDTSNTDTSVNDSVVNQNISNSAVNDNDNTNEEDSGEVNIVQSSDRIHLISISDGDGVTVEEVTLTDTGIYGKLSFQHSGLVQVSTGGNLYIGENYDSYGGYFAVDIDYYKNELSIEFDENIASGRYEALLTAGFSNRGEYEEVEISVFFQVD